jgi:hypothetical protein
MNPEIYKFEKNDNGDFVKQVCCVLSNYRDEKSFNSIRLIRIDNWFGSNWYKFTGKIFGAAGVSNSRLTIPPFIPDRVTLEAEFKLNSDGNYKLQKPAKSLHLYQSSEDNLRRYYDRVYPDSATIWFSGNSRANGRGSIMVYMHSPTLGPSDWYVELSEKKNWKPVKLINISLSELINILN